MTLPDLSKKEFTKEEIITLLSTRDEADIERIQKAAEKVLLEECGNEVHLRGLVEVSNICRCDCNYCGIRKSNKDVVRYDLEPEVMVRAAKECAELGYGSFVMQAGERHDKKFIDKMVNVVTAIKEETKSDILPEGLGITLSLGEYTKEEYQRFYDAGAHRYLLRIETTNKELFEKIHPTSQSLEHRIECLGYLRDVGYQVGTGVMIGIPGQTVEDLANDILFFKDKDIDMIGMGPFIPHDDTPMAEEDCLPDEERFIQAILMIAVTRLVLRDVNIAATTALQAMNKLGREKGLKSGANVIMPMMTPSSVREDYALYPGKPFIKEDTVILDSSVKDLLDKSGRVMTINAWGDSPHAVKRKKAV